MFFCFSLETGNGKQKIFLQRSKPVQVTVRSSCITLHRRGIWGWRLRRLLKLLLMIWWWLTLPFCLPVIFILPNIEVQTVGHVLWRGKGQRRDKIFHFRPLPNKGRAEGETMEKEGTQRELVVSLTALQSTAGCGLQIPLTASPDYSLSQIRISLSAVLRVGFLRNRCFPIYLFSKIKFTKGFVA